MTTDAWLAIAHHLAIFGVFAVLVAEWAIVRSDMDVADVHRLGRVDAAYGAIAALVLAAGVGRVIWGAKPVPRVAQGPRSRRRRATCRGRGQLGEARDPPAAGDVTAIPALAALMARGIKL